MSPLLFIKVLIKLCPEKINDVLYIIGYILYNRSVCNISIDGIVEMLNHFNNNRDMIAIINYHQEKQRSADLTKTLYGLLILYAINIFIMLYMYFGNN